MQKLLAASLIIISVFSSVIPSAFAAPGRATTSTPVSISETTRTLSTPRYVTSKTDREFTTRVKKTFATELKKLSDPALKKFYQTRFDRMLTETKGLFESAYLRSKAAPSKKLSVIPPTAELKAEAAAYSRLFAEIQAVADKEFSPLTLSDSDKALVASGVLTLQKDIVSSVRSALDIYAKQDIKESGKLRFSLDTAFASGVVSLDKYTSLSSFLLGRSETDLVLASTVQIKQSPFGSSSPFTVNSRFDASVKVIDQTTLYVLLKDYSLTSDLTGTGAKSFEEMAADVRTSLDKMKGKTVKIDLSESGMSARDLDSAKILQQISKALDILEKEPLLLAQRHILEGYTLTPNMPVIASLSEIFTGEKMTQKEMTDNSDESLEGASYLVYRLKNNAPELLLRVHERRDRVVASLSRLESGKYVAEIHGTDRVPGGDVLDVVFRSAELFQAHFVTDDTTGDILWKNDTLTATLSGSSTGFTYDSTGKYVSKTTQHTLTIAGTLSNRSANLTGTYNSAPLFVLVATSTGNTGSYDLSVSYQIPAEIAGSFFTEAQRKMSFRLVGEYAREFGTFPITEPTESIDIDTLFETRP